MNAIYHFWNKEQKEGGDQRIKIKKTTSYKTTSPLLYIFLHKFLVELRAQCVIDKAFLLPCFVHSFGAILEHNVIIPPRKISTNEMSLLGGQ